MENGDSLTVAEVVSLFISSRVARGVSTGYLATLRAMHTVVARWTATPAAAMTAANCEVFLASLDCAAVTKNNYLQLLRMAFRFARRRKLLSKDCDGPDVAERVIQPPSEPALHSPDELRRWFRELPPATWGCVALVAQCGVRLAEAGRMNVTDLALPERRATVSAGKAKTRARRIVPLCDSAREWLTESVAGPLGPLWSGSRMDLAEEIRNARRRAGVPAKRNGLRHSFISYRLAIVQSEAQVALEAGTSPECIFRHYREPATPEAAREWFAVAPDRQLPLPLAA